MALIRWEPVRPLLRSGDLFDEFFREVGRRGDVDGDTFQPAADVSESDDEVTVKMELPGVEKDKIQLSVSNDVLTVRGESQKETEEKNKTFYRKEIRYGAFQRAVTLPAEVEADKAKADLRNGVLSVRLPKSRQPKSHQIRVSAA
jgi:HSP20 family protein